MEGDERRQGFSLQDPLAKRRSPESGSSASNQLQEDSGSTSSSSGATPGIPRMGASTMLAGSSSASSRNGEIHERRTRQRITTTTHREDLVYSAPTATEQRGQNPGGFNSQQGEHQMQGSHLQGNPTPYRGQIIIIPDSALEGRIPQVDDPRIRTRLTFELRNVMGLQGRGGVIQYQSHFRVPGHWWLMGVVYQPDDEGEEDGMDTGYYEEFYAIRESIQSVIRESIGNVSTGLSEEVIMAKMKQRKHRCCSMTSSPNDVELCCICQEEYADNDDIGELDCEHEYHVSCIKQWLAQKNSCPICKKTALAT